MTERLIVEIFTHMAAGDRSRWTADQDTRPLSDLGQRQAQRLCDELAVDGLDGLYSSAALRARQTIEPLARRFHLPVTVLPGLHESDRRLPPPSWRSERFPANDPLGGAYEAGAAMRALETIRASHPVGRVAACTHGGVLPSLIVYLAAAYNLDLPAPNETRGGWYTLIFQGARVDVQHHDVIPDFPD